MTMIGLMTPCAYVARGNIDVICFKTLVFHAPKVKGKATKDLVIRWILQVILNITNT